MVKTTNSAYLNKKFKDLDFIAEDAKNELPEFEDGGETDKPVFGGTLKPVNIEAEAPDHIEDLKQAKKEYRKNNQDVGNVYLKRFEPQRQQTLEDLDKERMQQYAYDKAAQGIMNRNEYKGDADEYMQNLSPTRRKILKESSVWDKRSKSYPAMIEQAIVGGASGMGGPNFKNPNYTQQEAKESIAPLQLIEGVGGYAAKPLQGLSNKLGITDFENAKGNKYNIEQALKGKKNDASAIADIATDLTNFIGAGVGKQFSKLMTKGNVKAASKLIDNSIKTIPENQLPSKVYRGVTVKDANKVKPESLLDPSKSGVVNAPPTSSERAIAESFSTPNPVVKEEGVINEYTVKRPFKAAKEEDVDKLLKRKYGYDPTVIYREATNSGQGNKYLTGEKINNILRKEGIDAIYDDATEESEYRFLNSDILELSKSEIKRADPDFNESRYRIRKYGGTINSIDAIAEEVKNEIL